MKRMKKILAMLLALTMVLGMGLTAMAANEDGIIGTEDDRGTVSVSGVEEDVTVTVYPIAMADYDDEGNFSGYTNTYSLEDIENPTQAELAAIASTVTGGQTLDWDAATGTYKKSDLPVGMYLVCVTDSETVVYNVAVVSINYVNDDGENQITPGSVTMLESGATWVKKSNVPAVDKYIVENEQQLLGNTVDIGDDVAYEVKINPVPNYGGNYPVLNVVDTLEEGLTYNNNLAVTVGNTELQKDEDYTLDVNGQIITVNFVVNNAYTLNEYTGEELIISYSAKLTGTNVDFNDDENVNTAVLTYSKDSKTTGNTDTDTISTYTATFDIKNNVLKVKEDGTALGGATFDIYTDADCTAEYRNERIKEELVTDSNGRLALEGLDAGTYYLKEIAAPEGYSVNTTVFEIVITAEHEENGEIKSFTVVSKPHGSNDVGTNNLEIVNTTLNALPSTGGIGTTIFTVAGCGIMIAAAFFFFASRKKENE